MIKRLIVGLMLLLTMTSIVACTGQQTVIEQEKITVTRGNIVQSVNADGELSLPSQRELSFGITGTIDQMNIEEGDKVTKGQVLAQLELGPLDRAVKTAELAVSSAEVDLKQAQDSVTSVTIDLEQATDNYRKITYPYTYSTFVFDVPQSLDFIGNAERQIDEAQKVLQAGLTAEQYAEVSRQLRLARENLTSARQQLARGQGADLFTGQALPVADFWTLRTAQLNMEKAQSAIDNATNTVNKAKLAVDKAQYELETAQDTRDKATIKAPFDGVIAKAYFKAGDSLSTVDFNKAIFELIDPRHMELTIKVDEIDIPGIQRGQEAIIDVDALPDFKPTGKVTFIASLPGIEGGVVLYDVKISFDVPEGSGLKSGMSASADIVISQRNNVLIVPNRAITQDKTGKLTVKLLVNGQIQQKTVETGISSNFDTEIISGLNEGDTVVIERQVKTSSPGLFGG